MSSIAQCNRTSSKNVSLHPTNAPKVAAHEGEKDETARRERVSTSDHAVAVAVSVAVVVVVVVYCYHIVIYTVVIGMNAIITLSFFVQSSSEVSNDE